MKKVKYLLLLGLFAIITTGCVKFNANMNIKNDKSMDFSIIYAFDKTVLGEDNALKEEDFEEVKKQGFEATKYTEGNYEGFKLTRKIANIDDVSSESDVIFDMSGMMEEKEGNKYIFKIVKGTDKNTYIAKIKFDSSSSSSSLSDTETPGEVETGDEPTSITGSNDIDMSALTSGLDLSFSVDLPNPAVSSNATKKENNNKKLSWDLTTSGEQIIEFTFELSNSNTSISGIGNNGVISGNSSSNNNSNLILYIGIGVLALAVIVLIIILATKNKKPQVIVPVANPEPEEPEIKEKSE